eukprot:372607-Rhodomonas_salina.1
MATMMGCPNPRPGATLHTMLLEDRHVSVTHSVARTLAPIAPSVLQQYGSPSRQPVHCEGERAGANGLPDKIPLDRFVAQRLARVLDVTASLEPTSGVALVSVEHARNRVQHHRIRLDVVPGDRSLLTSDRLRNSKSREAGLAVGRLERLEQVSVVASVLRTWLNQLGAQTKVDSENGDSSD